jgi:hypothetical protein
MESESRTMRALYIVLQHIGTKNRQKLQNMIKTTENLEYVTKLKKYVENMMAWSFADANTIKIVYHVLSELQRNQTCPFDPDSKDNRSVYDYDHFSSRLTNATQMKYCLQMMATRGYNCLVCTDIVRFQFGIDYTVYNYSEIVLVTPHPDLVLPLVYPNLEII